jgi:transcriptional regulator with XRE-family HTH domain
MDFYSLSDKAIEEELGGRIRELRLRKNMTQQELAEATQLSLNTIKALEGGRGKISTVIAVLREMNHLEQLDNFVPESGISPLQLAKIKGKKRVRARSPGQSTSESKDDVEW